MGVGGGGSSEQPVKTSAHKSWARAPETGSAAPRNWRPRQDSTVTQQRAAICWTHTRHPGWA